MQTQQKVESTKHLGKAKWIIGCDPFWRHVWLWYHFARGPDNQPPRTPKTLTTILHVCEMERIIESSIWSQAKLIKKNVLAASLIVGTQHHLQCSGKIRQQWYSAVEKMLLHFKVQISFVFLCTPRGDFWKAQLWVGTPAIAHGHMEGRFKTADILRYLEKKLPRISIYQPYRTLLLRFATLAWGDFRYITNAYQDFYSEINSLFVRENYRCHWILSKCIYMLCLTYLLCISTLYSWWLSHFEALCAIVVKPYNEPESSYCQHR